MSVIIRLQNLPWSANALDIRNFFRGLSIPEGGVHIVGGELGDAFIAFSTDEDARQAMMLDCGKLKEIQVKLLLSSRSEMHKVIETARQSVPIMTLTAPAPAPAPVPIAVPTPAPPVLTPFAAALGAHAALGIPGIGNPLEVPQPAVIEPPAPLAPSPPTIITPADPEVQDVDTRDKKRGSDRRRTRSRSRSRSSSRSRSRDNKSRRRRRSRSRDRRRRRSRSRDRKDRRRDRRDRSRSRERISPWNRGDNMRKTSPKQQEIQENKPDIVGYGNFGPGMGMMGNGNGNGPGFIPRGVDSPIVETFDAALARLQELGKKRNPDAFQGPQDIVNGGGRGFNGGTNNQAANNQKSEVQRRTRFEPEEGSCVVIRGVPTHTSYGDLRRFFPFMIDKHGIKMINDHLGRRTGTVYVRFCEARSKTLALHRRNNELKGAEVRVEHLPDDEYDAAVDSFLPVRQEPPAAAPPAPALSTPDFTVLKLEELPLFVKEHDIIKAFSEFSLLSILLSECRATRTRAAYVQFVKPEDARAALGRRDRLVFGRRTATARSASDEEYEKEKLAQMERENPVVRDEKPPPAHFAREPSPAAPLPPALQPAAPRDPRQRRAPDGPAGPPGPAGLQTGAPFFPPDFQQQQMMPMQFQTPQFGAFGGAPSDPRWAARQAAMGGGGPPAQGPEDDDTLDCVLMKGLPQGASDRDIVEFLQETGAVPARIHLMLDVNGAPSGDCFCEFRSEEEARRAARRHGGKLQGGRVSVDPVPRSVVADALAPEPAPAPVHGLLGDGPPAFFDQPRGGFGPRAPFRGRGGFDRGGYDRGGFDRGRGSRGRGGFDRGGFNRGNDNFDRNGDGFNREEEDFDRGFDRGFNRGGRGFDRGGRGFAPRGFEPRGRGRGFGRGRGGVGVGGGPPFEERARDSPVDDQDPLEDFGAPGCVVSMENVPFRASVEEILAFFGEFNLSQDDVIRRFNERGQPTGDARVAFRTPFDAQRAVASRHMQPIHERRVALTIL